MMTSKSCINAVGGNTIINESLMDDSNYDPNRSENYIKYKVVMRDDLYSGENEKMLFPFVK